jgi:mono/diheme cytochrome c family protein
MPTLGNMIKGAALCLFAAYGQSAIADHGKPAQATSIERGRYLVKIAGCNDCHTPGYAASGGKVPQKQWLTGDQVGWRGPWGTTYPGNLRMFMQKLSEDQWVKLGHTTQYRPPMPWFVLRDMRSQDLRAIYQFIRHLGPAGEAAPAFVPPNDEPKGPVILFPKPPK